MASLVNNNYTISPEILLVDCGPSFRLAKRPTSSRIQYNHELGFLCKYDFKSLLSLIDAQFVHHNLSPESIAL